MSQKCPRVKSRILPHQADLLEHLRYVPESGLLYWRIPKQRRSMSEPAGSIARKITYGHQRPTAYRMISFNGEAWGAHRLIWVMVYGRIPEGMQIDHIDGDGLNNRLENLRLVTPQEQAKNMARPTTNTSGVMGVRRYQGDTRYWEAWVGNKRMGVYGSKREAEERVISQRLLLGYHKNHGRD